MVSPRRDDLGRCARDRRSLPLPLTRRGKGVCRLLASRWAVRCEQRLPALRSQRAVSHAQRRPDRGATLVDRLQGRWLPVPRHARSIACTCTRLNRPAGLLGRACVVDDSAVCCVCVCVDTYLSIYLSIYLYISIIYLYIYIDVCIYYTYVFVYVYVVT